MIGKLSVALFVTIISNKFHGFGKFPLGSVHICIVVFIKKNINHIVALDPVPKVLRKVQTGSGNLPNAIVSKLATQGSFRSLAKQ